MMLAGGAALADANGLQLVALGGSGFSVRVKPHSYFQADPVSWMLGLSSRPGQAVEREGWVLSAGWEQ